MTNRMAARDLFYVCPGIAELWQFKGCKVENFVEKDHLSFWFMANRFIECSKEWYHFQQELIVSEMVVQVFG